MCGVVGHTTSTAAAADITYACAYMCGNNAAGAEGYDFRASALKVVNAEM